MKPRSFVERIARDLTPGRVLDLACGSGRNAIWLAERGWDVTAVDSSAAALAELRKAAPSASTYLADLERHEFTIEESAWDLIIDSYYLQCDLFDPIQRGLKPGGVAIIIVHLFEPGHENSRFSLHPGELRRYVRASEIIEYFEGKPDSDPGARAIACVAVRR
jgi:SAM-dependent methyltransferase